MNYISLNIFLFILFNFCQIIVLGDHKFITHQGFENRKNFLNEWTVEIDGGLEVAELIALEFGYICEGEVKFIHIYNVFLSL